LIKPISNKNASSKIRIAFVAKTSFELMTSGRWTLAEKFMAH